MNRRLAGLLLLTALAAPAHALELVTNGDFEQPLTGAWTPDLAGVATLAVRATTFHPDPDYEVLVQKGSGNGHAKIHQTNIVPSPQVTFSIDAKLQTSASAAESHPWAAAAILLYYEDQFGNLQGTSCILRRTAYCPWTESSTFHFIEAADTEWNTYTFNLLDELQNFPGVEIDQVTRIRICLSAVVGGDC
jgi:hypothetical protein